MTEVGPLRQPSQPRHAEVARSFFLAPLDWDWMACWSDLLRSISLVNAWIRSTERTWRVSGGKSRPLSRLRVFFPPGGTLSFSSRLHWELQGFLFRHSGTVYFPVDTVTSVAEVEVSRGRLAKRSEERGGKFVRAKGGKPSLRGRFRKKEDPQADVAYDRCAHTQACTHSQRSRESQAGRRTVTLPCETASSGLSSTWSRQCPTGVRTNSQLTTHSLTSSVARRTSARETRHVPQPCWFVRVWP